MIFGYFVMYENNPQVASFIICRLPIIFQEK